LIGVKEGGRGAAECLLLAFGEKTMTLYLALVVGGFIAFAGVLFAVSIWSTLTK